MCINVFGDSERGRGEVGGGGGGGGESTGRKLENDKYTVHTMDDNINEKLIHKPQQDAS